MKFLVGFTKGNKILLKIRLDDGTEKWMGTTQTVLDYAQKNLKKEEDVKLEKTEKNGQYFVTKIMKIETCSPAPVETPKAIAPISTEPKCEDCGKVLKDAKYTKCWECNKKNPAPKADKPTGGRTDAIGTSIEKQAMMKASAQAIATTMQGQINDVNLLGDMIITLYEKLYKRLTE